MAEPEKTEVEQPRDIWIKPAVTFAKTIVMLFDVATVMVRLLINTLAYDSPLGKPDSGEDRTVAAKS